MSLSLSLLSHGLCLGVVFVGKLSLWADEFVIKGVVFAGRWKHVCCSVVQCGAVCCSVMQSVVESLSELKFFLGGQMS